MAEKVYTAIVKVQRHKTVSIVSETYSVGEHILVGYDDGSEYCQSDMHPFKYANGKIVSVGENSLTVKDAGKEVEIDFGWVRTVQDGTEPSLNSRMVVQL